jgi:hypothetical protein
MGIGETGIGMKKSIYLRVTEYSNDYGEVATS